MSLVQSIKIFSAIGDKLGTRDDLGIPNQGLETANVTTFLNSIYMIVGFIAVLMIIIGGISYITSSGDAAKATKAKNTIIYSAIGVAVIMLAFVITGFVFTEATK